MAKPVLAVDVDDVLYPLVPLFVDYHNENHGTNQTAEGFEHYIFEKDLGITKEQFIERFRKFGAADGFRKPELVKDAQEAIRKLSEKYDLVVVTSRWQDWEEDTIKWLHDHFPKAFSKIHFADSHTWKRGDKQDKASICQALGAVAFIDDSPKNVEIVSKVGIKSLLFGDYPWNRNAEVSEEVARVKDWNEVLEVLL